jgi:hypothetical protein
MAFECFWLHARNLIEFFNTTGPNANVVSPNIFTNANTAYNMGSTDDLMRRIHEQISHLQRNRGFLAARPS